MANKFILIRHEGRTTSRCIRTPARKPYGLAEWLSRASGVAGEWKAKSFAFRFEGRWHLVDTHNPTPVRSFPGTAKDAAVMWLVNREMGIG